MTTLTSFFKTDLVDDHVANDINVLIGAVLRAEYANTETITASKALTDNDCQIQKLTASGADRKALLPAAATTNHYFLIYNAGGSNNVIVKDSTDTTTYITLAASAWALMMSSGSAWAVMTSSTLASWAAKTAPSGTVVGDTDTQTLTNKRLTPRVGTTTSSATPTINTDSYDAYSLTAQAAAITSFTTNLSGTPTNFQKLIIRIKDDGTARAITWGASFEAKGVALPTTTVLSKVLTVGFIYDTVTSKWGCVAVANEA